MSKRSIEIADQQMYKLIKGEEIRQEGTLMMIPSENYASRAVRDAQASRLGDKYAEGYPGRRYYQGQRYADAVEELTRERAKALFKVPHVNVQPHSGSPANFAIYTALLEPGDRIMGLDIADGGHLTHGAKVSASSIYFEANPYNVNADGFIDLNQVEDSVKKFKPKMLIAGGSAYPRIFDWKGFARIAEQSGALFMVDMSHYAGLIAGGVYPTPLEDAHVAMTTTHKTLRGPRGAMILVTDRGLQEDKDMAAKIDRAVFPGLQGGPHMHTISAIGIALHEASSEGFADYARQVVSNAGHLGRAMAGLGFDLVTGGTDTHLLLVDLQRSDITGNTVAEGLEKAGIVSNRNSIPHDKRGSSFYPSGLRLGTPALTSRGMAWKQMREIGQMVSEVVSEMVKVKTELNLSYEDEKRIVNRTRIIEAAQSIPEVRRRVIDLCDKFPIKEVYNTRTALGSYGRY